MTHHNPVFDLVQCDRVEDHVGQLIEWTLCIDALALAEHVAVSKEVITR